MKVTITERWYFTKKEIADKLFDFTDAGEYITKKQALKALTQVQVRAYGKAFVSDLLEYGAEGMEESDNLKQVLENIFEEVRAKIFPDKSKPVEKHFEVTVLEHDRWSGVKVDQVRTYASKSSATRFIRSVNGKNTKSFVPETYYTASLSKDYFKKKIAR